MGAYIGISAPGPSLSSDRIGTNGAGSLLVEQWIAGWSIDPNVDKAAAAKARTWLQYFGDKHRELRWRGALKSVAKMKLALQDDTQNCTWVRGIDSALSRVVMPSIRDRELYALVSLWHASSTFYDMDCRVRITDHLADAVLRATERLEEEVSAWAGKCRDACSMIQRGRDNGMAYVSIG